MPFLATPRATFDALPRLPSPVAIAQYLKERRLRHLDIASSETLQLSLSPFLLFEVFHLSISENGQSYILHKRPLKSARTQGALTFRS